MLRAKEAEGVHMRKQPCSELARGGSKAPSLLIGSPSPSSCMLLLIRICPLSLAEQPGLEGLSEMVFYHQGY